MDSYLKHEKKAAQENVKHLQYALWRARFLLNMPDAHIQRTLTLIKYWRKRS